MAKVLLYISTSTIMPSRKTMKHQKNSFAALGFDDSSSENEEEMNHTPSTIPPIQMTIWGPAIGPLNWAEEMEREEFDQMTKN